MQWIEPSLWRNRAQAVDIFLGTCPTVVQSRSTATAYRSLLLPISLLQGNCSPVVGVQMFLKTWCPQMQLSTASSHSMLLVLVVSRQAGAHAQATSVGACLGRAWSSAKLKSANIFVHTSFGQSAKFISRQIFQLCSIFNELVCLCEIKPPLAWNARMYHATYCKLQELQNLYGKFLGFHKTCKLLVKFYLESLCTE